MRRSSVLIAAFVAAVSVPAMAQPRPPQTPPPLTYTQPLAPQAVQVVQQALQQQGAYSGRIDGAWGTDSQAALERFQQAHGLQVTGQLNQATAATLGLAPDQLVAAGQPPPLAVTAAPIAGDALSRPAVQAIQSRLRDLNFYRGAPDGVWGGLTQQAIERFQQGRGLQANGQLNPATIAALGLDPNILVPSR
jgi:peptidoglycan hydrolase-like protein with peptidoglycan-binding domain